MSAVRPVAMTALRNRVSPEEWQARVELAACYRLVAHFGWTDQIDTHISARVPGTEHFLINPYGLFFHEITASSLLKVDLDGNVLTPSEYPFNAAGFTIHSAVHGARADVACVLHTHTGYGMAVSAQAQGLLPLTQHSLVFHGHLAYHDYEGIALDLGERERLVADLGPHYAMILRNHGLLTCGRTIPEAFVLMYFLECSCEAQVKAQSGGAALRLVPEAVARHTADQVWGSGQPKGSRQWPGFLRLIERDGADYKE
ncbi:MAG: class II aldolase/adducin family protein [Thalassobaculales bacterium]